jgi:Protein of unknown function (DUF3562)
MHSHLEPGKEVASHEPAIDSLCERTGAPLLEVRRLFAQKFSRLELGAKVCSYLSVLTMSNVRTLLRRKGALAKGPGPMTTGMHDVVTPVRSKRLVDELARLWRGRPRALYRRLVHRYRSVPRFTNPTRLLRDELIAEGVSVWLSAGCLEEFATIASTAAARTRQADEPYMWCLRREIVTRARFVREWTSSDKSFEQTQWGELVSVARKYALPRPWKLFEAVATVRGHTCPRAQRRRADSGESPQEALTVNGRRSKAGARCAWAVRRCGTRLRCHDAISSSRGALHSRRLR